MRIGAMAYPACDADIQDSDTTRANWSSGVVKLARAFDFAMGRLEGILNPPVGTGGPSTTCEYGGPAQACLYVKAIDAVTQPMTEFLGRKGARRLAKLFALRDGWDGGRGKQFSYGSLATFDLFCRRFLATGNQWRPSVFLTELGNIQIEDPKSAGRSAVIEFFQDHFEFLSCARRTERSFAVEDTREMLAALSESLADEP